MKSDKLLVWIIVVIAFLSVGAVVMNSVREVPHYKNENTPESVVHDFVLAIHNGDYEMAYGFVYSEIQYQEFIEQSMNRDYLEYGIMIDHSEIIDEETAMVVYFVLHESRDLLGSSYSYTESATLKIEEDGGGWKIAWMYPYMMKYYGEEIPSRVP